MHWPMYVSWGLGPALQIALLTFIVRRKLLAAFPRFFSYVLFQVVKSGFLFAIYHYGCADYFYAYWTGNAISVFLALGVMDEVWRNLFASYEGIQDLGSLIFRWACGVLLLIVIAMAISSGGTTSDRVVDAVFSLERSMRLMQCGLFLLLLLLSRFVRNFWRQHGFGIALGFGIFASIELVLVSLWFRYGDSHSAAISLAKSAAYNGITLLWVGYLHRRSIVVVPAPQLDGWSAALTGQPETMQAASLIAMAEQAAERVLSRASWIRPSLRGAGIISRKPRSEDNN